MCLSPMQVSLNDLSALDTRYTLVRSHRGPGWDILIVAFSGRCRPEPERRLDDRYMHAMAEAGNAAWGPGGIVLDLSGLVCGAGDWFDWYNGLAQGGLWVPLAVVVGHGCEEQFREALDRTAENPALGACESVFRDLESALAYVDREV